MEKLKALIKKFSTKEAIFYAIFCVLTTILNIGTFYVLNILLHIEENTSNLFAIIFAALVTYITNKDLVSHSQADEFRRKGNRIL